VLPSWEDALRDRRRQPAVPGCRLGDESEFELARRFEGNAVPAPIVLISTHDEQDYADLIAESPAVGFLPKSALSAAAIRRLLDGRGDERDAVVSGPRDT
jgi:DNA-binding NarL/FixJ family response regulator